MPGSSFQKGKYREIAVGIGGHIHVEVVTEEIAFPMGVPAPVTVRLRIIAFAVAGRTAFFLAVADPLFPLLCCSTDRSAVTGKRQMVWIDEPFVDGKIQELLFIKTDFFFPLGGFILGKRSLGERWLESFFQMREKKS